MKELDDVGKTKHWDLWLMGGGSDLTFARLRRLVRRPSGVSAIPVSMGVADPVTTVGPV